MSRKLEKAAEYEIECITMISIIEARQNLEPLDFGYQAMRDAVLVGTSF